MLLNASLRPCIGLAAPQRRNLEALRYIRPISTPLVRRVFKQARGLATKIKKQPPAKAVPYVSKITAYEGAARRLAQNPGPTLLYQAHSNLPYILGCYFVGGVLLGCAIINNATKEASIGADVPVWVPLGVAVGQFTMVAFGGYWCLKVCLCARLMLENVIC